ncbi:MAG TPA: S8 family serine peptidase [Jiangellaceae bacterium]
MNDEVGEFEVTVGSFRFDPVDEEPEPGDVPADPDRLTPWIVQFQRLPTDGDLARLRGQYGIRLDVPIPELAYVERLDGETREQVCADPLTRACVPYRPEFKLSPSMRPVAGPTSLRAILFDDADPDDVRGQMGDAGATDLHVTDMREVRGHVRVRFVVSDPGQLETIAELDGVRRIEPVGRFVVTNVAGASTTQGGAPDQSAIWDRGLHGEGQIVGMLDDGPPDIDHCFLADPTDNTPGPEHRKIVAIRNASKTPLSGSDDNGDDDNGDDDNGDDENGVGDPPKAPGHATFVAACIAGDDHTVPPGTSPHRGGAWAAKLVCGNMHDGFTLYTEFADNGDKDAYIHSNSFVSDEPAYDTIAADADNYAWRYEEDLVIGGSNNSGGTQGPPGTAKNVLCVAAADAHPNHAELCSGVPGPTPDGRRKPDLVVVGRVESAKFETPCDTMEDGCATSWATAHAAAAAALVRQYFVEGWYPKGKQTDKHKRIPTGALLKAVLLNTTVEMAGDPDFPGEYPTLHEGWGRLQLDRSLYFEGAPRKLRVWDKRHAKGLKTSDTRTHKIDVEGGSEPLKVTLVWTEPPGEDSDPVVNDLDLRVTAPGEDAAVYNGNAFLDGESDPTSQFRDSKNNVEMVIVRTPVTGTWTIEVRAIKVRVGDPGQGYALVVSGDVDADSCFVATAVYGDPEHADVDFLREWRERHLSPGARGRAAMRLLVAAYARVGPRLAHMVDGLPRVAALLRRLVFMPAVAVLRRLDPPPATTRSVEHGHRREC